VGPPSGTVTFLFTDLEASTRLWEEHPKAMEVALARHDEILRSSIEAHDGHVFATGGDGLAAAFARSADALAAAREAQERLAAEPWPDGVPLRVRMGLHTGEAVEREGDYFGPAVNRAARLMAAGHGGQVLCSQSTAALVENEGDLVDLGEHRFRDVARPIHAFQLGAGAFPPLRTLEEVPGNLRAPPTSFVGRSSALAEVTALVRAHRLVTLTGVGGVGKTRLALEAASVMADGFPEGVWVIELGPVGDPAAVPDAMATTLGIVQQPGMSVADSVAAALAGRRRLLVVDNCEHVLDAAAELIEAILARSPTPKVLATSREGLGAADEQLWPVPSLDARGGIGSEAAALFVERARTVSPAFGASTPDDQSAVVEICQRLDGIPLAIELAASRMVSMTPAEVRDRLGDRFRLLAGSRRGLPRHQTLRHAVAWSYDLLGPTEQQLLARCSVFAGAFDLAAATAVATGPGGAEESLDDFGVLDGLDGLVRKSLLDAAPAGARTRYAMLETVRAFAEEQLVASGLADEARRRHAAFYAAQEGPLLALWDGPRQQEAYEWLGAELANLRSAFRWAADGHDLDTAATIAVLASLFGYYTHGHEPFTWAEELLGPARAVGHPQLLALHAMAALCVLRGRLDDGRRLCEEAKPLLGDPRYRPGPFGFARPFLGISHFYLGEYDRCIALCQAEIDRSGDQGSFAHYLRAFMFALGGREEARALVADVVAATERRANPAALIQALLAYSMAWRDADHTAAMAALRRGLDIAVGSGNTAFASYLQILLAEIDTAHGQLQDALDLLESVIMKLHDAGDTVALRTPLASLAVCLDRLGQNEAAATIAGSVSTDMAVAVVRELPATVARLRDEIGDATVEALVARGAALEPTDLARYALAQIELARVLVESSGNS
jgi:predicted ATPase/class 3 adenylate cyclase